MTKKATFNDTDLSLADAETETGDDRGVKESFKMSRVLQDIR